MKIILSNQKVTFNKQAYPDYGWAIIMAGIPGAGKSSAIKHYLLINAKTIDADKIKTYLLEKAKSDKENNIESDLLKSILTYFNGRIPDLKNEDDAEDVHRFFIKEKRLSANLLKQFLKNQRTNNNFILDTTNKSNSIDKSSKLFKELGYNVSVVLVATNLSIAKERVIKRAEIEGRTVSESYIDLVHDVLIKKFPDILSNIDSNYVDEFWVIFNNEDFDLFAKQGNCIKLEKDENGFILDEDTLKKIQANKNIAAMSNNLFSNIHKIIYLINKQKGC